MKAVVSAKGIIGEEGPVVTARHRYNGLGFRIMWQYDADADGTLEDSERYYQVHDERWRVIAVFRNQDASPKEAYVHHAAGSGGYGDASYIDSVILRDRDANSGWASESDGTLEERRYYCQNWRADVVAITKSDGEPLEYVRYSSYGEPTVYPVADLNMDGVVNSTDLTEWALLQGAASTNAAYANPDLNFDGSEDSLDGDLFYFDSYVPNSGLSGKGKLSSPAVGNRLGYAGYAWDPTISAYHVRHRVLFPETGRWNRRDPIGYVDGMSLYEYVNGQAMSKVDPFGLEDEWPHDVVPKGTPRDVIEKMIDDKNIELSQCGNNAKCRKDIKATIRKLQKAKKLATPPQMERIKQNKAKNPRRGFVQTKILGRVFGAACIATCAVAYDSCLAKEETSYSTCLKAMNHISPCGKTVGDESICDTDYRIGVGMCVTEGAACKLACLLPF